jgi:hypothetical protein
MSSNSRVWKASTSQRSQVREDCTVRDTSSIFVAPRHALLSRAVKWIVRLIFYGLRGDPLTGAVETTTGEQNTTVR